MGKERQRQKNEEIKKAIINTAIEISMGQGFDALSIRKITDKLGYSAGIIYYYFHDKQEILDTIHKEADSFILENIHNIFKVEKGFEYNLRAVFNMILELALEQSDKFSLIAFDKYLRRNESNAIWVDMIEQSILVGISTGELREVNSRLTAYNVWSSFWGLIAIANRDKELNREDVLNLFNNQLEIIMHGLKKEKGGN